MKTQSSKYFAFDFFLLWSIWGAVVNIDIWSFSWICRINQSKKKTDRGVQRGYRNQKGEVSIGDIKRQKNSIFYNVYQYLSSVKFTPLVSIVTEKIIKPTSVNPTLALTVSTAVLYLDSLPHLRAVIVGALVAFPAATVDPGHERHKHLLLIDLQGLVFHHAPSASTCHQSSSIPHRTGNPGERRPCDVHYKKDALRKMDSKTHTGDREY